MYCNLPASESIAFNFKMKKGSMLSVCQKFVYIVLFLKYSHLLFQFLMLFFNITNNFQI